MSFSLRLAAGVFGLVLCHAAHAFSSGLSPAEMRGRLYGVLDFVPTGSQKASLETYGPAVGLLEGDAGPALFGKPFAWNLSTPLTLQSPVTDGPSLTQPFVTAGAFSLQLDGVAADFLSGTIEGGTISGVVGDTAVRITLNLTHLSSDILYLAKDSSSIEITGFSFTALSTSCMAGGPEPASCPPGQLQLGGFSLASSALRTPTEMKWSIPADTFAAPVPEPSTYQLFGLGLALVALTASRSHQVRYRNRPASTARHTAA